MNFSRFSLVGFVVLAFAAVMNVGALAVAERNFAELRNAAMWVERAQIAVTLIESIYRKAIDAETGQRGYLLTQDATFLVPYADARLEIPKDLEKLRELTRDNPAQVAQLLSVQSLLDTRFAQIEESLALKRDRGDDAVREFLMSRRGQVTMGSLRLALDGVAAGEGTRYERRIQAFGDNQDQVHRRLLLVSGLNLVLITVGGIFLSQESRRRRRETGEVKQRNLQLAEAVRERTAELSGLSHYLQQVQEEERAKVARDIHDEMGGTLAAAKIDLQLLSDKLAGGDAQRARLNRIVAAIDDTIQVKRRIIEELRPTLLDNLGIGAALRWQCGQFAKRRGTPCRVELDDESVRLTPAYSIALYRVVQESLTNISKHAQAKSVTVSLQRDGNQWLLRIADDGVGIDANPHNPTAHGLLIMRERARALGGELSIQGGRGRGTVVEIRVPVEEEAS